MQSQEAILSPSSPLGCRVGREHPWVELLLSHEESQHSSCWESCWPIPAHPLIERKGFHRDSGLEASDTQH